MLKSLSRVSKRNMHINYIPMRWNRGDNYCYLLTDEKSNKSWIIDPAEPAEVQAGLKKFPQLDIVAIVNTHHHYDHAGGNSEMLKYFKSVGKSEMPVLAGHDSPKVTYVPKHKEVLKLGEIAITALHTPCHTRDSICWYAVDASTGQKALFPGDTLFTAGCGRFFEGNGAEMNEALNKNLAVNTDKDTVVYPGHEYTKSNIAFAKTVLKENKALKDLEAKVSGLEYTTGLFTMGDELSFNPFMRLDDVEVLKATKLTKEDEVMDKLREMKNNS